MRLPRFVFLSLFFVLCYVNTSFATSSSSMASDPCLISDMGDGVTRDVTSASYQECRKRLEQAMASVPKSASGDSKKPKEDDQQDQQPQQQQAQQPPPQQPSGGGDSGGSPLTVPTAQRPQEESVEGSKHGGSCKLEVGERQKFCDGTMTEAQTIACEPKKSAALNEASALSSGLGADATATASSNGSSTGSSASNWGMALAHVDFAVMCEAGHFACEDKCGEVKRAFERYCDESKPGKFQDMMRSEDPKQKQQAEQEKQEAQKIAEKSEKQGKQVCAGELAGKVAEARNQAQALAAAAGQNLEKGEQSSMLDQLKGMGGQAKDMASKLMKNLKGKKKDKSGGDNEAVADACADPQSRACKCKGLGVAACDAIMPSVAPSLPGVVTYENEVTPADRSPSSMSSEITGP